MSKSSATAIVREVGRAPADQMSLWGRAPVLTRRASGFVGRVTLEVWSDGGVNSVGDPSLFGKALGILQLGSSTVRTTSVPIAPDPIMGSRDQADFLGRVIVEFWNDGAEVGVLGADERRLVDHAVKGLGSHLGGN